MYIFVLDILPTIICCICVLVYSYNRICYNRVPIIQGPNLLHQHFPVARFCRGPICRQGAQSAQICRGPICLKKNSGPNLPPTNFPGPICLVPNIILCGNILGPRGLLGTPSFVRWSMGKKNLNQL